MSKNLRALSARYPEHHTLFSSITAEATTDGTLTQQQIRNIAQERLLAPGIILGSSSFYDFLQTSNSGKQAYRCTGTACMLSEQTSATHDLLASQYSHDEVGEMACVGRCYHGGGMQAQGLTLDQHTRKELPRVLDGENIPREQIPFFTAASINVFGQDIGNIGAFYQLIVKYSTQVIPQLETSGLRGRGGAGFPFITKLKACTTTPAEKKYIVCNADEGDPGAFSDRYLLEQQPQRVLGGMLAAGLACGSSHGFLYIRAEYPEALELIEQAIEQYRRTTTYAEYGFEFHMVKGAGSYVCGEETALLNSIEGLRPEVRVRPPYPAQEGLFGQPTLLSNVETFAAIPWIIKHGGAAFAAVGTQRSTGTKLVSLDHSFVHPGVYEVDMGLPLDDLIHKLAGGFRHKVKALQVGGPLGGVLPITKNTELSLDFESFADAGFLLGHAGIIAIPDTFPMLDFLRHLFEYMASESCGKCVPCRIGTRKGAEMLQQATPEQQLDSDCFNDLLETLELGSLCALGGGLPLPARNILEYFADELTAFVDGGGY
ncbi:MAG: formate dehydrogenase [Gammaproteobacteria bacterium]|nr:formate dehydrogenase [Gammaproteobacteria bacterium]